MTLDVIITELFAAAPEVVWEALTDPEVLAEWLMPNDFVPEVGRTFTFVPDHVTPWDGPVACMVLELRPHHRMVWSWMTSGMDRPSRVEFLLSPKRGGTELVLKHTGEAEGPVARGLKGGWPDRLGRFASTLEERAGRRDGQT